LDGALGKFKVSVIELEVLSAFFARVAASDQVSDDLIQALRDMLTKGKLPKPEELARLFAAATGDALA
jgi:hypothetical protein